MIQTSVSTQVLDPRKQSHHLQAVIELSDRCKKTIGFLPRGAFGTYSRKGQILVALDAQNMVVGYLLYALSGVPCITTIVHLCVDPQVRGAGVARQLVKHLSRHTQHTVGIKLSCRRDYPENNMWPKLGFAPVGRKKGRSFQGHELDCWWMDHGHTNLFNLPPEAYSETARTIVALDANVLFDLSDPNRDMHQESVELTADWIQPLLEMVVTDELFVEIHRQPNPAVQRRSQQFASQFRRVAGHSHHVQEEAEQLRETLGWPRDDNTLSDLKHLVHLSENGGRYFISRDQRLIDTSEELEAALDVQVLSPAQLILRLDEIQQAEVYRPQSLGGSTLLERKVTEVDQDTLYDVFKNQNQQELKGNFQKKLRVVLAQADRHKNQLFVTAAEQRIIFASSAAEKDQLNLKFLRSTRHPFAPTLLRHLLNRFVLRSALELQLPLTVCSDPAPDGNLRAALQDNHFFELGDGRFVHVNLPVADTPEGMIQHLQGMFSGDAEVAQLAERIQVSLEEALDINPSVLLPQIERAIWPGKILHDGLPSFVVPIKPRWAQVLFDENLARSALFGSPEHLLLNWENVYYRAARPSHGKLKRGARILWYVSQDKQHPISAITACSLVDEVTIGYPRELYRQFKRLGVYRLRDLLDYAGDDTEFMMAIRFSHTELFTKPISFRKFNALRQQEGLAPSQLVGPLHISTKEFQVLYNMGHGR